jgi:hypothetical protein
VLQYPRNRKAPAPIGTEALNKLLIKAFRQVVLNKRTLNPTKIQ